MKGKRKPFSPKEYERSDKFGKDVVSKFLKTRKGTPKADVVVPKENQGPDIEVYFLNELVEYHEVEVRHYWNDGTKPFPFKTVHIPARKSRLILYANTKGIDLTFWSVSGDGKSAIEIPSYLVTEEKLVEVPNRRVWKGEYFYDILVSDCTQHSMEG